MNVYKGVCHPSLCDLMGHMTTRHYIAMFDDASYHFLHSVFGWSGEQAKAEKIGWADVRHLIEYQAEVAEGDLLDITAALVKVGNKSITVNYHMRNISRDELAATLESTSVYFDLQARVAMPITAAMREAAQVHLPSHT
ncbi:MAG: acyl-CoA thioesterase [Porticoccaceae bacterium]|nr:acyl-CoA thioesterase [Porticoccaceae bacterium]